MNAKSCFFFATSPDPRLKRENLNPSGAEWRDCLLTAEVCLRRSSHQPSPSGQTDKGDAVRGGLPIEKRFQPRISASLWQESDSVQAKRRGRCYGRANLGYLLLLNSDGQLLIELNDLTVS